MRKGLITSFTSSKSISITASINCFIYDTFILYCRMMRIHLKREHRRRSLWRKKETSSIFVPAVALMFGENFQKTCWYLKIFAWQNIFWEIGDFECQQINVCYESLYYLNDFNVQTYFDYICWLLTLMLSWRQKQTSKNPK